MDITFRGALLLSVIIHCAVIIPLSNITAMKERIEKPDRMVVDYVVIKEPQRLEAAKSSLEVKVAETPKVEPKKPVELKPRQADTKATEEEKAAREMARRQTKIRSTKDYINYYQLIRERIRARLKNNYKSYHREGDVHLVFTLDSDGTLVAVDAEIGPSTADRELIDIAISSIREASPYPAFPKVMSLPRMSFNLIVSFKKQ